MYATTLLLPSGAAQSVPVTAHPPRIPLLFDSPEMFMLPGPRLKISVAPFWRVIAPVRLSAPLLWMKCRPTSNSQRHADRFRGGMVDDVAVGVDRAPSGRNRCA